MKEGIAACKKQVPTMFRMLVTLLLCMGLMVPAGLLSERAYAEPAPEGDVVQTSEIPSSDPAGASIVADQKISLRQSGDSGTVRISLADLPDGWAAAVTSVTVEALTGDDVGTATQLSAGQYALDAANNRISFTRTADDPVFSVASGEGEPIDITRWGSTTTYPQSKQYQVTIKADGFADAVGTATFYTGTAAAFSIIVDADGNPSTTDDRTVVGSWTSDEIKALAGYGFHNGSSQCGMTGFRTFSGWGVSVTDLLEAAGVSVGATDSFLLDTSDHYGNTFTYDQLFGGERYFLQSVYDDQEVKDTYARLVSSDNQAGATIELRRLLAAKALEDGSTVAPMVSTGYAETMLGKDDVASAELPTALNSFINPLVALENQFRFIYGIRLVQDDCTVTFDTGAGSQVAAQTVKSHVMTSTENTTIKSSYWANSLVVYRNAGSPVAPSTAADALSEPADPTRDGYAFAGWYTDGECTDGNEFDFEADDGTVDANTTLYAKWVENAADFDLGVTFPTKASFVSTSMGRNPAGETTFSLKPSDGALASYQALHPGATNAQMLQAWINGITSVTVDGVGLSAKEFGEWKAELTDPESDQGKLLYYWLSAGTSSATLELPIALFDTSSSETDTKTVSVVSSGFTTVTGDVTYRNIGADAITVRVLDKPANEGGTVSYERTFTIDEIKAMTVQSGVETSANCGMAGLRSYLSEGVYLTDLLDAAGVNFAEGMTLKLRTTDSATTNDGNGGIEPAYISSGTFTYENLLGVTRYHYPAMWDNTTTYEELGGKTIYEVLSANMRAWKGTGEEAQTLARLIGQSKVEVASPLLAWTWNEGVVAWNGTDPSDQGGYNRYTSQETFRFLFGMKAADDGSITDDNTTFANTYGVFGIDIIADEGALKSYGVNYEMDGGVNDASNPLAYTAGDDVTLALPTKAGYTFAGWFLDAAFATPISEISPYTTGDITLYAKWVADAVGGGDEGQGDGTGVKAGADGGAQGLSPVGGDGATMLVKTGEAVPLVPLACFAGASLLGLLALLLVRRTSGLANGLHRGK